MNVLVDVQHACDGDTVPDTEYVESWVTRAVECGRSPTGCVEVSVRIVDAD